MAANPNPTIDRTTGSAMSEKEKKASSREPTDPQATDASAQSSPDSTESAKSSQHPDLASRVFAAELVIARVDDLLRNLPYLHDPKDIEHVHQVRVACRRLRTAFRVFGEALPAKAVRRWSKRLRQLGRALGAARDLDVQMEFLDRRLGGLEKGSAGTKMRPGLERLRLRLAQARRRAQRSLRRKLAKFARSGLVDEMDHSMRAVVVEGRLDSGSSQPQYLWRQAESTATRLIGDLLLHEPSVTKPERIEDHHEMRIAAKHLRYALEAYAPLYDGTLRPFTAAAKQLQQILGDLHDCDVWIAALPEFIRAERKRTKRFYGHARGFRRVAAGLEALLEDRLAERGRIHAAFVEQWQEGCGDDLWEALRETLRRPNVASTTPNSESE